MGTGMAIWKILFTAIWPLLMSAGVAVAQTEHRVALVIGNGSYLSVGRLRNPANDAASVAAMLRHVGFEVIEQEDASRRAMIQATRTFAEKLSPGGIGLLFYAGHGIQSQGANYLVPVDASLAVEDDLKYETLDLQDILNKLDDARVRLSIVILDACRDNPFRVFRSATSGLAMINPPAGTVIAYATAPGKVAQDGSGDHSVFTAELLKAMGKPDKLLDVFEHVTDAVERQTGNVQTPWINSSFRGDFYFTGPTTVTITPPPDPPMPTTSAEIVFWQSIASSTNPADFEAYLKQFPQGSFAALAQIRLASLATRPNPAQPPQAPDPRPPEVKDPKPSPAPVAAPKPVATDQPVSRKAPPPEPVPPVATTTSSLAPRVQPVQPPATLPPAVTSATRQPQPNPVPPPAAPAAPTRSSQATSAPVLQTPIPQPAQEAMVRPPPAGALQPLPPDALQPPPTATAPRPESSQQARSCDIQFFGGMGTGAGAYATIRVVNTGDRCGRFLYYQSGWQNGGTTGGIAEARYASLSLSKPPSHGSVAIDGSAFYYTPSAGFVGNDEFAIVSTPYGHLRAVVTVLPLPPAPTQPAPTAPAAPPESSRPVPFCEIRLFAGMETGAGGYATIRVANTGDRCGGQIWYRKGIPYESLSLSKPPSHGSVTIEGSAVYYTPSPAFFGDDEFAIISKPSGHGRSVVTVLPPAPARQ
jgi:hypothetical protein